jgi:TM2 domain-containing membrane protein YozV
MTRVLAAALCVFLLTAPVRAQDVLAGRDAARRHLFAERPADGSPAPLFQQEAQSTEKKSVGLAALYSLLLPGMGELYADGFSSGKYFLLAEGVLWLTFASFEIYGNSLQDDARAFATANAGLDPAGKDDQYFVDIGNFMNIREYNEKQARDREPDRIYTPAAAYAWQWQTDADRAQYRDSRIKSEEMWNNKKFVAAAILINHVASAINAGRSAAAYNKANATGLSFRADVLGGLGNPHGVQLTVTKPF